MMRKWYANILVRKNVMIRAHSKSASFQKGGRGREVDTKSDKKWHSGRRCSEKVMSLTQKTTFYEWPAFWINPFETSLLKIVSMAAITLMSNHVNSKHSKIISLVEIKSQGLNWKMKYVLSTYHFSLIT